MTASRRALPRFMRSAALAGALLLLLATSASADTILLKNGRRIIAFNVVEDGDHVRYETPAGQMSIPKSIVLRIDRDNLGYSSAGSTASSAPPVSAPEIDPLRGTEDISHLVVHNDAIDFVYIAQVESDARSGAAAGNDKAAAAHYVAAQYLVGKGDTPSAIDHYRQALSLEPDSVPLLLNLAVLYLRQSQFTTALEPLDRAKHVEPNSPDVAKLMGWAYYGANKMDLAVAEWTRSEKLRPDKDVEHALEKAERDKAEEESYREGETAHFALKYNGSATPGLLGVILYTEQSFADITRAPSWAGAINDGRIRVPVQGLTSVTPELARVLKHELTHSFVGQKSHNRAPTWLQEGTAQFMEGRRSTEPAGALLNAASQGGVPTLPSLEGSWMSLSGNSA